MFLFSLIWLLVGLFAALITLGARLRLLASFGRTKLLSVGVISAYLGGWLGLWLFGSLFAIATALWIAILACFILPPCILWLQKQWQSRSLHT